MQDQSSPPGKTRQRRLLLAAGVAILLAVAFLAGLVGAAVGRRGAAPETEIVTTVERVTDVVEVTREVIVVLTPTAGPTATAVDWVSPPDSPVVVETTVPGAETDNPPAQVDGGVSADLDFSIFNEVWNYIEGEFDGELPADQNLIYGAISGSIGTLDDQYTRFIPPELAEKLREDLAGSVSGIGAFVRENDDGLIEVTRPIDGQPADLAGLLSGDVIIAIDGESVVDLGFDEVLLMVRGPEGTPVTLTVFRPGADEPLDFTIVRAVFEVPVIISDTYEEDGKKIAYIRLTSFTRNANASLQDALQTLLTDNPDGLIFDLRDNGGGFLDQAVAVADAFLPQGVILFERNTNGDINKTFESESGDLAENIPLVVLVNSGSASASEIVAGAIKDNNRGTLIGETTFGKGSVQLVHALSDGSELRVTIARWFTPENQSISENGISPDIEEPTPLDLGGEDDNQLQRAIEFLINRE